MKVRKCPACKTETERSVLDSNYSICPACGHYMRFHAKKRLQSLVDKGSFKEWDGDLEWSNPLNDKEYAEKVEDASRKHNLKDAIITGEACIEGNSVAIGVMDTRFMMASMGQVVGERVTRLFERATGKKLPVILFCCSGGARMQEGIISPARLLSSFSFHKCDIPKIKHCSIRFLNIISYATHRKSGIIIRYLDSSKELQYITT